MIHHPEPDLQADRLRQALAAPDQHGCAAARQQIAVLVEAERAGQDVDAAPAFAALLHHLDRCAACVALYIALSEDLALLLDMAAPSPQILPSPPSFFTPTQQSQVADSPTTLDPL